MRMRNCHRQGTSVVSCVAVGSEKGTDGSLMSAREGVGTPGRREWEDAGKLLLLYSAHAALSAQQALRRGWDCETCLEISDLSRS